MVFAGYRNKKFAALYSQGVVYDDISALKKAVDLACSLEKP